MNKLLKSFYGILSILFLIPFLVNAQNIKITQDYPPVVKSGEEFVIFLHIDKATLTGAARLQQDLPAGFTAKNVNSQGSDFVFENNSVKFIWSTLPDNNQFTVSYSLKSDNTLTGKQLIKGEFVYNNHDQVEHQPLESAEFTIEDDQPALADEVLPSIATVTPKVERKLITVSEEKGEYRVELTFSPNNINESAQFIDVLPENYSALVIDAHNSKFSFDNQSVIFSWEKFPEEKTFVISYLVRSDAPAAPAPVINGTLVYGDVIEINQQIASQLPESKKNSHINPISDSTPRYEASRIHVPIANTTADVTNNESLPANDGIFFKIQISATQKSAAKNNEYFKSKYKITMPVEMTMDEGWKKYLVGSFQGYDEASQFKNQSCEKVGDAFIVAYQNGTRIPVNEAIRNKQINQ